MILIMHTFGHLFQSLPVRDAIRDCLDKQPTERSEEDIDLLMDFMQHFRVRDGLSEWYKNL